MRYEIRLTPLAVEMLTAVKDQREREKLAERIEQLKPDPDKQGNILSPLNLDEVLIPYRIG